MYTARLIISFIFILFLFYPICHCINIHAEEKINGLNGEETLVRGIEAGELRFPEIKVKMDVDTTKKPKIDNNVLDQELINREITIFIMFLTYLFFLISDINECFENPSRCSDIDSNAYCQNKRGSFECKCRLSGFLEPVFNNSVSPRVFIGCRGKRFSLSVE